MRYVYPSNQERDRALYVIHNLFENNFYSALCYVHKPEIYDDYYDLNFHNWFNDHKDLLEKLGIVIYTGETKACIIDNYNRNWVIKVNFDRTTCPSFVSRQIAWDFCEREVEFYSKACDNNLQDCFAATYQLGVINNVYISIQEAVTINEDFFDDKFREYVSSDYDIEDFECEDNYYDAVDSALEDIDDEYRIYAVLGNESDESDSLIEFIEENNINDLHAGNWGITNDGRYVLIDFSGYTI